MSVCILTGDCRATLSTLGAGSAQMCVTSPPYFGLRDYGHAGQIGLESTPDAYVAELVAVFREVRRVLKDDGTLWLNLGDSYSGANPPGRRACGDGELREGRAEPEGSFGTRTRTFRPGAWAKGEVDERGQRNRDGVGGVTGLAPKNLIGIPWRVAFALQADGWYLRSDIIWHKPNPMPESVTDRPTKSHEYLFLLAKSERYFYDADAIAEDAIHAGAVVTNNNGKNGQMGDFGATRGGFLKEGGVTVGATRNRRTVWTIATQPFKGAHFATFPTALIEPCILAGSAKCDTVLDPFGGAGTTGLVADRLGRSAILCDLNPTYAAMAERRIHDDSPLFSAVGGPNAK